MKDILTVFSFTLRDGVRKKAFQITTILVLALIVIACAIPRFMDMAGSGSDDTGENTAPAEKSRVCYFIDEEGLVPGALQALGAADPSTDYRVGESGKLDAYRAEIEEEKNNFVVVVAPGEAGGLPKAELYVSDFMNSGPTDTIASVIKNVYLSNAFTTAGVPAETAQMALGEVQLNLNTIAKMDLSG